MSLGQVSTRSYFAERGITNHDELDSLETIFGENCNIYILDGAIYRLLHICLRTPQDIQEDLQRYLQAEATHMQPGIQALVRFRRFGTVPTIDTARLFTAEFWEDSDSQVYQRDLGPKVPDWFFPAMVVLAGQVRKDGWYGPGAREEFETRCNMLLNYWHYGPEELSPPLELSRVLSDAYLAFLRLYKEPDRCILPELPR